MICGSVARPARHERVGMDRMGRITPPHPSGELRAGSNLPQSKGM